MRNEKKRKFLFLGVGEEEGGGISKGINLVFQIMICFLFLRKLSLGYAREYVIPRPVNLGILWVLFH